MKRYILIPLFSVVFGVYVFAGDTNTTEVVPSTSDVQYSNDALSFLMASSGSPPEMDAPTGGVATNKAAAPKPAWDGSVSLGLTATAGNVNSALATGNVRVHRKAPQNELTLLADAAYGEVSSVKNTETLHGAVQYNQLFGPRWYGYVRGDGLHDGIADVTYRFMFSPGIGYYLVKEKATSLALEAGPAILTEKLDDEYHTYPVVRLGERFEHKFDGHAKLWETFEFLPPVNRPREFLINAEIGLETPLTKVLSLQTYVDDNYANRPAPGFKDNDLKIVSAVAIKF